MLTVNFDWSIVLEFSWKIVYLTGYQVNNIFSENKFDAVMHFAAVAYVGESTLYPLK